MIIDCHGHVSAPAQLWVYKANLVSHLGAHGRKMPDVSDEEIIRAMNKKEMGPCGHVEALERVSTDMQALSPRPFQMMHSAKPGRIVHWFTEETNNIVARTAELFPGKFIPVAGLPQVAGAPVEETLPELERCVKMGFRGVLLNPDPYENTGTEAPALGDRYWYPLYEKLCELDIPMHIHATGSHSERSPYTLHFVNEETIAVYGLVHSDVFKDFPQLKVICSHGGGSIPYQIGRFQSAAGRAGKNFLEGMRNIYYDTVLYSEESLRLLIKTVGADRCLFGSECPGVGSTVDPSTGRARDDLRPVIASFDWLGEHEKQLIFEDNARKLFGLAR
ncbi:amidohydrolase family protein [Paraburkholderia sp. CNPSo 3157]|uniref:Amidohydrolase family protein n=1 Tax=Paraburkholderia franconis TaxID=2654983 RepID=A0A7X1NI11_9BURK|nr:amidohydrolase family protein [Paraburkholderia franconis]MPW22330.1 amidohydrolase family protein [Paraburkholderia franconis]